MPTSLFPLPAIHFLTSPSVLPSPCRTLLTPPLSPFTIRSSLLSISVFFLRISFFSHLLFFFSFVFPFSSPFLFLALISLSICFSLLSFILFFSCILFHFLPSFLFFPFFRHSHLLFEPSSFSLAILSPSIIASLFLILSVVCFASSSPPLPCVILSFYPCLLPFQSSSICLTHFLHLLYNHPHLITFTETIKRHKLPQGNTSLSQVT